MLCDALVCALFGIQTVYALLVFVSVMCCLLLVLKLVSYLTQKVYTVLTPDEKANDKLRAGSQAFGSWAYMRAYLRAYLNTGNPGSQAMGLWAYLRAYLRAYLCGPTGEPKILTYKL